jgi:hypothetical protein
MAFEVQYFTLDSTDATNMYVTLDGVPVSERNVALDIISGTAQMLEYTSGAPANDFGVDGTRIRWDSTNYNLYDSTLVPGDQLRVIYDRV